jgi:hypothetical protein
MANNPAFETIQFKHYQENLKNPQFDALIDTIQALNVDIRVSNSIIFDNSDSVTSTILLK